MPALTQAASDADLPRGVSVVVPVYRSEATLRRLVEEIEAALAPGGAPFEIILVNDGSPDGSWARIAEMASSNPRLRGINLMRNFGQHNALLCGIREARFDRVVTLDDDLQNPPAEIPSLLAGLEGGCDVVYGVPRNPHQRSWRLAGSSFTRLILAVVIGRSLARNASAFRALRTELRQGFVAFDGPYLSLDVLLTWVAARYTAIEVQHQPRAEGVSGYNFRRLVTHGFNMLTGFSSLPLRLASLTGMLFMLFGIALFCWVVAMYLIHGSVVKGFPFLASQIAIFSGAQLFALGIIGEYLARIHFRTLGRPTYVIRSTEASRRRAAAGEDK